jgi:hypothetical protein
MPAPNPYAASLKPRSLTICSLAKPKLYRSSYAIKNRTTMKGMIRLAILT